jgi:hypothetical protein
MFHDWDMSFHTIQYIKAFLKRTIDDPLGGSQKGDFYDSFRASPEAARMILQVSTPSM